MGFYAIEHWLIRAFLDVFIAYCLLIASFSAFIASKFFDIFCLFLAPQCDDLLDYLHTNDVLASLCDSEEDDECSCCLWQRELADQHPMKPVSRSTPDYRVSDSGKMTKKRARSCFPLKRRRKASNHSQPTLSEQASAIRLLEKKLHEEQAARISLQDELEKERSSAAIAAEEAMAMIHRLQEEKAATAMKAKQFQRITEEKTAYDTEEMALLKEILMRREMEKIFLEKELEDLRLMLSAAKELDFDDIQTPPCTSLKSIQNGSNLKEAVVQRSLSFNPKSQTNGSPWLLRRNSMSDLDYPKTLLHNEVGLLRERLKIVQQGRDKLSFSAGYKPNNISRVTSFKLPYLPQSSDCLPSNMDGIQHRLVRSV